MLDAVTNSEIAAWLTGAGEPVAAHDLTAYDAQYVALARELPARLLTTDERMAAAARALGVAIAAVVPGQG